MSAPSPPPPPGSPTPLAARLADLYAALARAADEPAILAAVAAALTPYGLSELRLAYLNCDERGRPREAELIASWPDPAVQPIRRLPAAELTLAHVWLRSPDEAHWIPDLDADPRIDPASRARLAAIRSIAAVPLRDERQGAWQGVLLLGWSEPHTRGPEEEFLARVLLRAVTAAVAARRGLQAHADALGETGTLYDASAALGQADSIPGLLEVLAATAAPYGATRAWLFTRDDDPGDRPAHLTLQAAWPDGAPGPEIGQTFPTAALGLLDVWLRDGLVPAYFTDVGDDRRIDDDTRAAALALGVRGAVAFPLAWRGRWTAIVVIGWPERHTARSGEQRLYTAVARQAAVVLDNRLLLAQAQRVLAEHSRQRSTLATLLDNLPVGVYVNDPHGESVLLNHTGAAILGELRGVYHVDSDLPMDRDDWTMTRATRSVRAVTGEADFVKTDGTRITVATVSTPLLGPRGELLRVLSVFQDITARRRADAERARLQDDLVRLQAAALAERSAPLIPVTDEILVMPIVGAVDPDRGHQILETLVNLGGRTRVRVAILDLTGVRDLDLAAADAILGAARALRLRGAVPILTGLRADTATLLTDLGIDLHGLQICSTLQAAILRATAVTRRPT
jgi:PAS domain S-box-containing protein